jgi:hypothetical protein
MSLQELFQAMNMFKEGVNQMSVTRGISNAQQQMNQLNSAQMDEIEKRNALQGIANNLALDLGKTGAPVHQIQSAVGAVAPTAIKTADDAILQGALAGPRGASLTELGKTADMNSAAPAFEQQQRTQDFTAGENAKNRQMQLEIAGLRNNGGKGKIRNLTPKEIKDITSYEEGEAMMTSLANDVEQDPMLAGIIAGRIPLRGKVAQDFAAFKTKTAMQFNEYRLRITGAGAGPTELAMLEKVTPIVTDSPKEFISKARTFAEVNRKIRNRLLKNMERGKADVSGFEYDGKDTIEAGQPAASNESSSTSMKIKGPTQSVNDFLNKYGTGD